MLVNYNMEKLKRIIDDLSSVTKINFDILDTNFHLLYRCMSSAPFCDTIQGTSLGANKCLCSDTNLLEECKKSRSFQSHICHAGLKDAAAPIIKNEIIVGYIVMGQIRGSVPVDEIKRKLSWMKDETLNMVDLYQELPAFSDDQINSLSNLLSHIFF